MTPTPVGVQISEDVPLPGEVLVAEGIRVPENIRVPEGVRVPEKNIRVPEHFRVPEMFGYSTEKNWNHPTRSDPKKCSTRTPLILSNVSYEIWWESVEILKF